MSLVGNVLPLPPPQMIQVPILQITHTIQSLRNVTNWSKYYNYLIRCNVSRIEDNNMREDYSHQKKEQPRNELIISFPSYVMLMRASEELVPL